MTLDDKVKAFLSVNYGSGDGSGYGYGDGSGYGSGYGDGDGDGYGDGSGYGSGYGSGDGYGYGSGYGDGDGDGYGDGSGYGSGYGSGDGYGYGSGYGSGDGYGYGDGIKRFNREPVYRIDGVNTLIRSVRGNTAHGAIVTNDLTLAPCYIVKQDGVFAHGETLREAMEALRDKLFEDMPEDERIDTFLRETDCKKAYPTQYFYDWHHRLTGSCDMGRKQFAHDHGVDLEHGMMTLTEFLEMTKDAYGGDAIRKVIDLVGAKTAALREVQTSTRGRL